MSEDELFPNVRSLSPRAKWLQRHMLTVVKEDPVIVGETDQQGFTASAFYCMKDTVTTSQQDFAKIGQGPDEEGAAEDYAQKNGLQTWHGEDAP